MNSITGINVKYSILTVELTIDGDQILELNFDEFDKISSINLDNFRKKPSFRHPQLRATQTEAFSPAVQAALSQQKVNFNEAVVIQDYTSRGFANSNASEVGNLLYQSFPKYWEFLQNYRAQINDPHAI